MEIGKDVFFEVAVNHKLQKPYTFCFLVERIKLYIEISLFYIVEYSTAQR